MHHYGNLKHKYLSSNPCTDILLNQAFLFFYFIKPYICNNTYNTFYTQYVATSKKKTVKNFLFYRSYS